MVMAPVTGLCLSFMYSPSAVNHPSSKTGKLIISFRNSVDALPLELNKTYINSLQEPFKVTRLKYYISHIELDNTSAVITPDANYFLVNEEAPVSKTITVPFPAGSYHRITFLLGVDSLRNVSGAQSGALDPLNGMFWTWNSGYIMAKLEGRSPASSLPLQQFEFHIGGFQGRDNVLKKISLAFPGGKPFVLKAGKTLTIDINANIQKWFQGPRSISIATHPSCTTPGSLAKQIADNYAEMFSIVSVTD